MPYKYATTLDYHHAGDQPPPPTPPDPIEGVDAPWCLTGSTAILLPTGVVAIYWFWVL